MIKRCITGACLIAVVTAFFFLREVHIAFFTGFIGFLAVFAAFEFTRALGERIRPLHKNTAIAFAFTIAPLFHFFSVIGVIYAFMGFAVLQLLFTVILNAEIESFAYGVSTMVYPTLFVGSMLILNALSNNSTLALLMVFVVSSFADTFAYLVGSTLRGPKLCPKISPNKSWSGAIGGVIGGILMGVITYLLIRNIDCMNIILTGTKLNLAWLMILGGLGSAVSQVGDIFESLLKRKAGVKDSGNFMPGHGGMLDRVDALMFALVFVGGILMFLI